MIGLRDVIGPVLAPFLILLLTLGLAPTTRAHEGPPFPVLVDDPHPPYLVEVWADPDVGLGTFWVQLRPLPGKALPEDTEVHVEVAPSDGREEPSRWPGEREPFRAGQQHRVDVEFPTREFWDVVVEVSSESAGVESRVPFVVEVTPPGYGQLDLLLYVWPFLAVAFLWFKALLRTRAPRRRRRRP